MIRLLVFLLFCGVAHANLIQAPTAVVKPPPTQVPAPPPLQGVVQHIPASSSDQTAAINSTINAAAAGDTIFFDAGLHTVCGTVTEKAGQLYIGPSATYPLQGQNSRATLDGCNYSGQLRPASNTMTYGLSLSNMLPWVAINTTGASFRNNIQDLHNADTLSFEFTCHGGDTNTTIDWNTQQNGSGNDNSECEADGDNSSGYTFTRNSVGPTSHDAVGASGAFNHNTMYSWNYFHDVGLNCGACGTASAIEVSAAQQTPGDHTRHILNNYISHAVGYCLSVIGDYDVGHNYCTNGGRALEWDARPDVTSGAFSNIHDNNMDGASAGSEVLGPYAPEPGSSNTNNVAALIDNLKCDAGGNCSQNCVYTTAGSCADYGVAFTPA